MLCSILSQIDLELGQIPVYQHTLGRVRAIFFLLLDEDHDIVEANITVENACL